MPVARRACSLMIFCVSFSLAPKGRLLMDHASTPYRAMDCTHVTWILAAADGETPFSPQSLCSRDCAARALLFHIPSCLFRVSWESRYTPSHLVASWLNLHVLFATGHASYRVAMGLKEG
jgi:hypothetical protein